MRAGKLAKWIGVGLAVGVVCAGLWCYVQGSRIPADYHPAELTAAERLLAAKGFYRKIVNEFGNGAQQNEPYEWSVDQQMLNGWLASMDEIAAQKIGIEPGAVHRSLERLGLSQPAVACHDGVLTLMVRSDRYSKILSVDLRFSFTADSNLRVQLSETRLGRLPLPGFLVRERLDSLAALLREQKPQGPVHIHGTGDPAGVSPEEVAAVLRTIIAGIDAEPIPTELTWPVNDKRVRIENVRITEGWLRLDVAPINRGLDKS